MYRILVVEDEALIRKGIVAKIKHNKFDFERIEEASDGREALAIMEKDHPDIVITDVKMPHIDGIELIRKAKELYQDMKFIIISGYAEFEYAEQALNMGVCGYILKPVTDRDLVDSLTRVIKDLDNSHKIKEIYSKKEMLEKHYDDLMLEKNLNQVLHAVKKENGEYIPGYDEDIFGETEKERYFLLAIFNIDGKTYYESSFKYQDLELIKFSMRNIMNEVECDCKKHIINNYQDNNQLLLIIMHKQKERLKLTAEKYIAKVFRYVVDLLGISVTVGVSGIAERLSNDLYLQAKEAFDMRIIHKNGNVYRYDSLPITREYKLPSKEIRLLQKCIERKDYSNIEIVLKDIFSEKNLKGTSAEFIRIIWIEIINMLFRVCGDVKADKGNVLEPSLLSEKIVDRFESLDQIVSYLYTTVIGALRAGYDVDMSCNNKIKLAVHYIDQHYQEDISLNDLAYRFAMNPSYFSTVFKKVVGKNVTSYIADLRIEAACRLLKETQKSIVDISRSIGYEDIQYFYRVFKNKTGMTPMEFRKKVN